MRRTNEPRRRRRLQNKKQRFKYKLFVILRNLHFPTFFLQRNSRNWPSKQNDNALRQARLTFGRMPTWQRANCDQLDKSTLPLKCLPIFNKKITTKNSSLTEKETSHRIVLFYLFIKGQCMLSYGYNSTRARIGC